MSIFHLRFALSKSLQLLSKIFPSLMGPGGKNLVQKKPAMVPHFESSQSTPQFHLLFLNFLFLIIMFCHVIALFSYSLLTEILFQFLIFLLPATCTSLIIIPNLITISILSEAHNA
jgi:hypothetical protein